MTLNTLIPADFLTPHSEDFSPVDAMLHRRIVSFGYLPPAPFVTLGAEQIAQHAARIQSWIGTENERTKPLAQYRDRHAALHAWASHVQSIADGLKAGDPQLDTETKISLMELRRQSLLSEAQLQAYEGVISTVDLTLIQSALTAPDTQVGLVRALQLCIVTSAQDSVYPLDGVLVITTQQALQSPESDESAILFVPGEGGGLQKFWSLQALKEGVQFTLQSGLDTPLWRHVAAPTRSALMAEVSAGSLQLITRAVAGSAVAYSVNSQINSLENASRAIVDGQRFFADAVDKETTQNQLQLQWLHNIAVHSHEIRDQAIERIAEQQRTAELVTQMPQWLLRSSSEVRRDYALQLSRYHSAVALLERQLHEVLPSLEVFTQQHFSARIRDDLGIDIDPDNVFIDLPQSASRELDIDPQYGTLRHGNHWQASVERMSISLTELARHNLDSNDLEMSARLTFATIDTTSDRFKSAGLTVEYLVKIIPIVDIADQYLTLLRTVFQTQTVDTPPIAREVLLEPYALEILLEGFAAVHKGNLSAQGYQLLQWAAHARSNAQLRAHDVQLSWIVLNPGHAVSGDTSSATLSGVCVIHHKLTATTLIYLPQAPDGVSLIEASSLHDAKQRLINRLEAQPSLVQYLASRVDDETRLGADQRYINESLLRNFDGFINFSPASFLQVAAQQVDARARLICAQAKRHARSNYDIRVDLDLRKDATYWAYFRALLSFLPGLGTLISLQDGWNDGHAAASAFAQGRQEEGEQLVASATLCALDILLSVVPGVATVTVLAKTARRATRLRQSTGLLQRAPSVIQRKHVLKPFDGYEVEASLRGGSAQTGINNGTVLHDGQLWIRRNDKVCQVYRRAGEQTLRLRKVTGKGYEPPVRLNVLGRWVYHMDVGLKGGVKSSIAETLIMQAHVDPAFTRKQARARSKHAQTNACTCYRNRSSTAAARCGS